MDLIYSLPILLLAIVIHEACGHKFFAEAFTSLKPTLVAIGIPIVKTTEERVFKTFLGNIKIPKIKLNTVWKRIERQNKVPIVLSWLLIGGGVGFDDKQYYSVGKLFEKLLMIFAGPLVNIIAAFTLVAIFSDLETALSVTRSYALVSFDLLKALVTSSTVMDAFSSHGFYKSTLLIAEQTKYWQVIAYFALWNISLAVTNLLPIPGLDGGQIVSTLLINVFGERVVPGIKKINTVSGYLLIAVSTLAVAWWIVSSLVSLVKTLVS